MRNRKGTHNITGAYGERIARKYLENKGFLIISDNYQRKWGEIDIIAQSKKVIHFIEVKTVSYDTKDKLTFSKNDSWRPEEMVHAKKLCKMGRVIETWILEHEYEGEWQIDVIAVKIVVADKYASVKYIDNIVV